MEFDGYIHINSEIILRPGLSNEEFKKSRLYNNEDMSMFFWINGNYQIFEHNFIVGVLFENGRLKQIHLYCSDDNITNEAERKFIQDKILQNISNKAEYNWGGIKSVTSKRDGLSTIVITYY